MLISTGGTIRGKNQSDLRGHSTRRLTANTLAVSIPLEDNLAEYFIADAIVYLDDANGKTQQFRLERPERTLDALTAFGWHITYDLAQDMVVSKKYTSAARVDRVGRLAAGRGYKRPGSPARLIQATLTH